MPRLAQFALSLGAVALLCTPALAQRPGGGGGGGFGGGPGGGGALMLAQNKSVAAELKLTDDQEAKIKAASDKLREQSREAFQSARDLDAAERDEKMADLRKQSQKAGKKAIADVLTPEQAARLAQIERQQAPLAALAEPETQGLLKLTASQKKKIAAIHDASMKEMRDAMGGGRGGDQADRRERMEKLQAARKEADDKAVALLSDEQKSTWKDLLGADFELKREGGRNRGAGAGN